MPQRRSARPLHQATEVEARRRGDGAIGPLLAASAAETFAAAPIWRHKGRFSSKCVRDPRCGVVLAPKGHFPQQVRTKPPLWRRSGTTRGIPAATTYEARPPAPERRRRAVVSAMKARRNREVTGESLPATYALASAWSRSAMMSSTSSIPTESRMRSSERCAALSCSGVSWECVVEAG